MKILFLTNNINVTRPLFDWLVSMEGLENVVDLLNAHKVELVKAGKISKRETLF